MSERSILIVEDDARVAESIQFVLERHGFEATLVPTSEDAEATLKQRKFSCALIDVWLGGEDGLTLLEKIRKVGCQMPTIIMSGGGPGRTLEHVSARADMLDARAVLFKPFTDEEMLTVIRNC